MLPIQAARPVREDIMSTLIAAKEPDHLSPEALRVIESGELETADAHDILSWGINNFHPRLALSASFGGPEGMALLHMLHALEASSRVFVIDTGRLPQETHDLIDRVRDRYDKPVEVVGCTPREKLTFRFR